MQHSDSSNCDFRAIPPALIKSPLENTQLPTAVILRSIAQMSGQDQVLKYYFKRSEPHLDKVA